MDESVRKSAQELIDWLLDRLTIKGEPSEDGRGVPISWEGDLKVTVAGRELAAIVERDAALTPVMRALARAKMDENPTPAYFTAKLDEVLSEMPDGEWRPWTFALPLSIKQVAGGEPFNLRIYGQDFAIMSRSEAEQFIDQPLHEGALRRILKRPDLPRRCPKYYLIAEHHGPTQREAWERLTPAFDTLMGYLELFFSLGRHQILGDTIRSQIRHPEWMLWGSESGDIERTFFITDADRKRPRLKITADDVDTLQNQSEFIREEPKSSSTAALLADAFRLYHQAMNRMHKADCFLGLWQTLEVVVRSETINADSQKIVQRAAWYTRKFDLPGSGMNHLLEELSGKRNDIVHHGFNQVTNEDINLLKLTCDTALMWVLRNLNEVPTKKDLEPHYKIIDAHYRIRAAENQIASAQAQLSS
jgi:hypothetical protein